MHLTYIPGACSLAVHAALKKAGATFEVTAFDFKTGKLTDGRELSAVSEKGYVPVLSFGDGEVLSETSAILMSLDELYPEAKLLPSEAASRRAARQWLIFIATELHKGFAPLFSPELPAIVEQDIREKLAKRFDYIASELSGRDFLMGSSAYAPDFYLAVMLLWASMKDISIEHWPSLQAYKERILQHEAVNAAMKVEGLIPSEAADA